MLDAQIRCDDCGSEEKVTRRADEHNVDRLLCADCVDATGLAERVRMAELGFDDPAAEDED